MSIQITIDPKLRINRVIQDAYDLPRTITVNKFDEDSAKLFNLEFEVAVNTKQDLIPIVIDSYGGQIYSLLSMIDTIKSSPVPVATIAIGKAMSCGAALLTQGSNGFRFMSESTTVLIHEAAGGGRGKVEEMVASTDEIVRLNKQLYQMMSKNCGKPADYFTKICEHKKHADWYLDAKECKKHNIVNKIGIPTFKLNVRTSLTFGL
jgi:ATP-dependent Clp protease protease subunit